MKRLYIGIFLLFPTTLIAQTVGDTLRREVTIEKNFTPIVRDASKINTLPEVEELTIIKQSIKYSDWVIPTALNASGIWIPPAGFSVVPRPKTERGYVDFAIGNYWNIIGNAGYRILRNERDRLGVWAQHRSTSGTVDYNQQFLGYPTKRHMRQLSEQAVVDYSHTFNALDWGIQGGYRYDDFNYYGLQSSLLPTPLTDDQQVHRFFFKSDVASTRSSMEMNYRASLAYYRMDFQHGYQLGEPGVAENEWVANFTLNVPMDGIQSILLDGGLTFLNYNQRGVSSTNYAVLTLIPRYDWRDDRLAVSAGFRTDVSFSEGTIFRFAPQVNFDWHITSGIDFYAILTGGKTLNTWRRMSGYTLYFNPSVRVPNTYTPLDFSLGFRTNLLSGFSMSVSGGYNWSKNALFVVPEEENNLLTGMSRVMGIDAHAVKASAEASYRYDTRVEVQARVDYCYRMNDRGKAISYDRPRWAGSFSAIYRPIDPLSIEVGYQCAIGRDFTLLNLGKLGDVHLVNLKATYQVLPQLSVYLLGDNLLNCKYDVLYGMPAQGICFMAGVDFKF